MTTLLLTLVLFALCMVGLGIGLIVANRGLQRSCGGGDLVTGDGDVIACGACAKKEAEVCPSDDNLVRLAQIAHPNPRHHH
ncbi:MAG: hypothetical protein H6733_07465 [Alphaproteobacteria bacterium]|nr:hypothetical protein [Alphaproteobacteria bacterium]